MSRQTWTVAVEAVAHGGWAVVIRIAVGPDRDVAREMASVIRAQQRVELRELDGDR